MYSSMRTFAILYMRNFILKCFLYMVPENSKVLKTRVEGSERLEGPQLALHKGLDDANNIL